MRVSFRLKLSLPITLVHFFAFGQSIDIQALNAERVDNFITRISQNCGSKLVFPGNYRSKWVRKDVSIVKLFNEIANKSLREENLENALWKYHFKFSDEILNNGLLHARIFRIQGKYLKLSCTIDFANDVILHQKFVVETKTSSSCGPFLNMYFDYKILKQFFLKKIASVISPDFTSIVLDTTYFENIRKVAAVETGFTFILPDSASDLWINDLILAQYMSESYRGYSLQVPPKDFLQLVKLHEVDLLTKLLYSPNYCLSINAMEALVYLNTIKTINFTNEQLRQIAKLKSERVEIISQIAPDAFYPVSSYSQLGMTDERVIAKYRAHL